MTQPAEPTPLAPKSTFLPSRALFGVIISVAGHAVVILAAFLVGRLVKPSSGGGFEDLAGVAATLVGGELVVALAGLIVGVVLIVRGRRDLGVGLIGGWLLGGLLLYALATDAI